MIGVNIIKNLVKYIDTFNIHRAL